MYSNSNYLSSTVSILLYHYCGVELTSTPIVNKKSPYSTVITQ